MNDPAAATLSWVNDFVVAHNLCPFAATPLRKGRVAVTVFEGSDEEQIILFALRRVGSLLELEREEVETELLVFPNLRNPFEEFLAIIETVESVLAESGADQLVQLAHFHPDYRFRYLRQEDPANATNRSPYPTLQLLRTVSVTEAVAAHPDTESIPRRNVEYLRKLSDQ